MSLIFGEGTGPEWEQGWREKTLAFAFETPSSLLAFFAVTVFLACASYYLDRKASMEQTVLNLELYLFLLVVILILFLHLVRAVQEPRLVHASPELRDRSPWAVAAVVVLLLVLISYQSSFRSKWFVV
ncbi:hypothetical protein NMG60_11016135 [Bertholletia excelsa]